MYVSSTPVYQEKIVQILERHQITIDRITTTPTASEPTLEGKESMERGHHMLSCRTSVSSTKVPEIKLHLKVGASAWLRQEAVFCLQAVMRINAPSAFCTATPFNVF